MQTFNDSLKEAEQKFNMSSGGGYAQIQNGDNLFRILTPAYLLGKHFNEMGYKGVCVGKDNGCPGCLEADKALQDAEEKAKGEKDKEKAKKFYEFYNKIKSKPKYLCYAIDHRTDEVKLLEISHGVLQALAMLQNDKEWGFSTFPMIYSVNIKKDENAPSPRDYYKVVGSPKGWGEVSDEKKAELAKLTPPEEIIQRQKDKKIKELTHKELAPGEVDRGIEYPKDEISPDDIPFN